MLGFARRGACAALTLLTLTLAAGPHVLGAPEATSRAGQRAPSTKPVDLNTADVTTLTGVPGIGPALARRIVAWRDQHGPFRRVEDLLKVQGIGEKSLAKLRPHVEVKRSQ